MITKLLDGLEVFFNVYEVSQVSINLQMAGGCHIYRPPSRGAVASGMASVHPVTLSN